MHYKTATSSTHTLMKAAFDDVEKLMQSSPNLKIQNPETLIAAFVESATKLYIHELLEKQKRDSLT